MTTDYVQKHLLFPKCFSNKKIPQHKIFVDCKNSINKHIDACIFFPKS